MVNHKLIWLAALMMIVVSSLLLTGCGGAKSEVYRVGILAGADPFNATIDGFKAEMAELGYREGESISYDFQAAGGDQDRMNRIAEKFVTDEVDLILTTTTEAAKAAQTATAGTDIPIVFTIVLDPLADGLVNDLREPGGNITGVSRPLMGFMGRRVEYLHQVAPEVKRIWLLFQPDYLTTDVTLQTLHPVAQALGIELIETPIRTTDDLLAELNRCADTPDFDAIMIMPDPVFQNAEMMEAIGSFANEHKLLLVGNTPGQVEQGAFFIYSDYNFQTGQLAAPLAEKILKGAEPATIPVAFAEPRLFINTQLAQTLGLEADESLLTLASDLIH